MHGQTGDAESRPVLAVVTVFVSKSTMRVETRSVLALLHAYSYTTIDTDKVVQEFCTRKPRSLAFEFWTHVRKPFLTPVLTLLTPRVSSSSLAFMCRRAMGSRLLLFHLSLHFIMPPGNSLRKMIVTYLKLLYGLSNPGSDASQMTVSIACPELGSSLPNKKI